VRPGESSRAFSKKISPQLDNQVANLLDSLSSESPSVAILRTLAWLSDQKHGQPTEFSELPVIIRATPYRLASRCCASTRCGPKTDDYETKSPYPFQERQDYPENRTLLLTGQRLNPVSPCCSSLNPFTF